MPLKTDTKNMKKNLLFLLLLLTAMTAGAQEQKWLNLQAEVRVDYQKEYIDGDAVKENSGFKGKYFNLMMSGELGKYFSYSYRQRLNKPNKDASFFDATDWIHLTYSPTKQWSLSAGKQVVAIGGYEYDRAPIDIYWASEYWHHIACYQFGGSVSFATKKGNDRLTAQVCNSPFDTPNEEMYAYNLMWTGNHKWFSSLYSANMLEYAPGKFICYLSLGNEFRWGNAKLQLDFMNRATNRHAFFFKDCSVVGELSYLIKDRVNVFGKVTYDVNATQYDADHCVAAGTEVTRVGGGVEFYPLKGNRNIRLHANGAYTLGTKNNKSEALTDGQSYFDVGLKWKVDLLAVAKKCFKK